MISYLVQVAIYFIILTACGLILSPMLSRYKTGASGMAGTPVPKTLGRLALACIPFFRFWVVVGVILMAFAPDSFVEEVNEKARLREENK